MARYKVNYWLKRDRATKYEGPIGTQGEALSIVTGQFLKKCAVITLVRDDESASLPDNAGKFFLDRIIK